jgi:Zn-finger domain-containing protein
MNMVEDNLYDDVGFSRLILQQMQQLSTLQDIRNSTHLRT